MNEEKKYSSAIEKEYEQLIEVLTKNYERQMDNYESQLNNYKRQIDALNATNKMLIKNNAEPPVFHEHKWIMIPSYMLPKREGTVPIRIPASCECGAHTSMWEDSNITCVRCGSTEEGKHSPLCRYYSPQIDPEPLSEPDLPPPTPEGECTTCGKPRSECKAWQASLYGGSL